MSRMSALDILRQDGTLRQIQPLEGESILFMGTYDECKIWKMINDLKFMDKDIYGIVNPETGRYVSEVYSQADYARLISLTPEQRRSYEAQDNQQN